MSVDEVLDELLGEQFEGAANPFEPTGRQWDDARREATTRMLDAAIGALAATGHLVAVAEEVLRDQRDRLAPDPPTGGGPTPAPPAPWATGRHRIDLSY